jgi:hypothetical protein
VATVVDGVVTAHAYGVVTISARSGRARADATITVAPAESARIAISPRSLTLMSGAAASLAAVVFDAHDVALTDRVVSWRSLDPAIASVDGTGLVRALAGGRTQIVATVGDVADTISVTSRVATTLSIVRTGTNFDSRGEIASFIVSSYDQQGVLIDSPSAQWSVTAGGTLLNGTGPRTDVLLKEHSVVVLTAQARGLRASLSVVAATSRPPASPTPAPPTPPPSTPPNQG